MLYEVTTTHGNKLTIEADSSKEAKLRACKTHHGQPYDNWRGINTKKCRKLKVDYPENVYHDCSNEQFEQLKGKDVLCKVLEEKAV